MLLLELYSKLQVKLEIFLLGMIIRLLLVRKSVAAVIFANIAKIRRFLDSSARSVNELQASLLFSFTKQGWLFS